MENAKIYTGLIDGVVIIAPEIKTDERGSFVELFRSDFMQKNNLIQTFPQDNMTFSIEARTLRGLHFQYDKPMAKLVSVVRGSADIIAVDIRRGSPTFGKATIHYCCDTTREQVYIAPGFAVGWITREPGTQVHFKGSRFYNESGQGELRYDSVPDIKELIDEGELLKPEVISERDKNAGDLIAWLNRPEADLLAYDKLKTL